MAETESKPVKTPKNGQKPWLVIVACVAVVVVLGVVAWGIYRQSHKTVQSTVPKVAGCNGTTGLKDFSLEEALDPATQAKGLGGRDSMPQKCGMLFVFDHAAQHGIWMKDMKFNLDIMWLDQNKRIISIRENAPYNSFPEVYSPQSDSKYVIELNAHQSRAGAFRVGQILDFDERPAAKVNNH